MRRIGAIAVACSVALFFSWDPQQHRSALRRHLQQRVDSPFEFVIYLALEYVHPTVASQLESGDLSNDILDHFCGAVNTQASGTQVQIYAQALSAVIETSSVDTGQGIDYGCSVLATNRVFDKAGENLFATGVLVLEIAVQQLVNITGNLSLAQTNNILGSGFSRGDGGRIKFRDLLQEHEAFSTLINVEVIDGPLTPSETRSPIATSATAHASMIPTISPPTLLSDYPSMTPSSATISDTEDLTTSPSSIPADTNTQTNAPPIAGNENESTDSMSKSSNNPKNRRQPLIFGAIAGGIATIFVSCFFIFCVWFPFCGQRKRRLPRPPSHGPGASFASSSDPYDDDDTPGGKRSGKTSRERSCTTESFDESSIYTSTFPSGLSDGDRFQKSPRRPDMALFVDSMARVGIVEEESIEISSASGVESSVASASSLMAGHFIEGIGELEETKEEVASSKRSTKGFDPFTDDSDSSLGFAESVAISDPSFGTPVKDVSRFSPSSTKTKRIDNLVVHVKNKVVSSADGSAEEGKDEGNSILDRSDSYGSSVRTHRSVVSSGIATSTSLSNNALLRSVLENARELDRRGGSSRVSLKSAPSRVTQEVRARLQQQRNQRDGRLANRLSSHIGNTRGVSVRNTGARSLTSLPTRRTSAFPTHRSHKDHSPHPPRYNHASFASPDLANPFGSPGSEMYTNSKISSHSSDVGVSKTVLYDGSWDGTEEKASSRVSSPGVLGIASISDGTPSDLEGMPDIDRLSYPWLFEGSGDVGSGRDQSTNSASSTWSVRSDRSGGSISSESIQSWTPKKSNSGRPPLPHGPSSEDKRGAKKGARSTVRTLESDLSKLRDIPGYRRSGARTVVSTTSAPSATSIKSAPHRRKEKKQRLDVLAPPGKVGVVLSNRLDGRGTYISEVRPSSSLRRYLRPGDKLVAIDGEDVSTVSVSHITDLMQSKVSQERRLTVLTAFMTDEATFHTRS